MIGWVGDYSNSEKAGPSGEYRKNTNAAQVRNTGRK